MSFKFSSLNSDFSSIDGDPYTFADRSSLSLNRGELDDFLGMDVSSHLASSILRSSISSSTKFEKSFPAQSFSSLDREFRPINQKEEELEKLVNEAQATIKREEIGQQLEEMESLATSIREKIHDFFTEVKELEEQYKHWKLNFSEYGNFQGNILAALEYFDVNHEHFLETLKRHISPDEYNSIETPMEAIDATFKWTNCIAPLVFNVAKFCISNQIQSELEKLKKRFHQLKSEVSETSSFTFSSSTQSIAAMDHIQQCIDQLGRTLAQDQQEALVKGRSKLDKLVSKLTCIPLEKIGGMAHKKANRICKNVLNVYRQIREIFEIRQACKIQKKWIYHLHPRIVVDIDRHHSSSQEELYREVTHFLKSLDKCKTIKEVQQKLKKVEVTEIPSNFNDWLKLFKTKRFRRYLVQSYYYCTSKRAFMQPTHIQSLLHRREAERKKKIDQSLPFIYYHIGKSQHLDLDQLTAYFDRLHIHFNHIKLANSSLPLPPQSKEEWNQCIRDTEFCKALAAQWIDYQETTAQLAMQMMRQALLSKNHVERKFLAFRGIEYIASIASSIVQLALCLPQAKLWLAASVLELFVTDLAKLGIPGMGLIYVFHPLYSDITFKLDSLIMMLAEHFFAIKYKPNEYSFEGYKLVLQIRWLAFVSIMHYFISLFKQLLLWLNMRLVENCMLGLEKKPIEQDSRYIHMTENYERHRLKCKHQIKALEECLNKLRIEDTKLMISPQQAGSKQPAIDPIQQLVAALEDANFDFFPKEVLEFFEEHGLKLTETNKVLLKENIEQFLCGTEDDFINSYQACREDHLKV
jgi:hypothetical protein